MANILMKEDFDLDADQINFDNLVQNAKEKVLKSDFMDNLSVLAKYWEGVRANSLAADGLHGIKSQSGTVHCRAFFGMLQSLWKISDGFVDFGSGRVTQKSFSLSDCWVVRGIW
jgi:hypothetical protein